MLIHKLPQTPYTAFPLDWQVWAQESTVYSAFSKCILWWAMDLVGKPNTTSPIWNHFHSCHPSAFVQVSSSSRDRKRPAGQVCVCEAFSKLAKYERDSGKWKMSTRNVATRGVTWPFDGDASLVFRSAHFATYCVILSVNFKPLCIGPIMSASADKGYQKREIEQSPMKKKFKDSTISREDLDDAIANGIKLALKDQQSTLNSGVASASASGAAVFSRR